jgi:hypothetical protein
MNPVEHPSVVVLSILVLYSLAGERPDERLFDRRPQNRTPSWSQEDWTRQGLNYSIF